MTINHEAVERFIAENLNGMQTSQIDPKDIEFDKRFEILCFYCARYNRKWTCPPRIPKVNYKEVFLEYSNALLVYHMTPIQNDMEKARNDSSIILHRALLDIEKFLFENGNSERISFIGGSCKLCKNGCAMDNCRNPYEARIPLEATSVNVIRTAEKCGIEIKFPVVDMISRIGLILW